MGFLEVAKHRYIEGLTPELLRSRRFWAGASALAHSPLVSIGKSDRAGTAFALKITRDAYLRRGPVVWANLLTPSELLHGCGAVPVYPEVTAAVICRLGLAGRFLETADAAGFPPEMCSYHRVALGAALEGFMPEPDALLSSTYLCDSATHCFDYLSERYGCEHRVIEVPYESHDDVSLGATARQLEGAFEMLLSLRRRGGRVERLSEAVRLSNDQRGYMLAVEQARTARPSPVDGWEAMGQLAAMCVMPGSRQGVDYYSLVLEEARRATGRTDEKRLLWMHLKPCFETSLEDVLRSAGAVLVSEEYNRCYWDALDPGRPFSSLSRKMTSFSGVGPAARRAEIVTGLARRYAVDGAVHFNHRGCRQSSGCAWMMKEELAAIGVPTLILDGDCIDRSAVSDGQAATRLQAFLESLEPAGR